MYTAIKGVGTMIFTHTAQKKKFFVEDFFRKCDTSAVPVDMVTIAEEILIGKLQFFCSVTLRIDS